MKKILWLLFFSFFLGTITFSQEGYIFTDIKRLPTTSVKDQYASGTCWAFSAISFLESEMIRNGMKLEEVPDISEMYVVRKIYEEKAQKYVRFHGAINFAAGGSFFDVIHVLKNYGLVPENIYPGLNYGWNKHNHDELDKVLKAYVDVIKDQKTLTTAWFNGFRGILDAYFGQEPINFVYKNKTYTPLQFAKDVVKLNADDYVSITSYTHHPFWTSFVLEIPDNWIFGVSYNVPMEDMLRIAVNAINNGYTVAWAADVSEPYFSHKDGIAVVPDLPDEELVRTERSRWESVDKKKMQLDKPGKEKTITQQMRQDSFDNFKTTDDHGMHIIGLAKDQNGAEYFIVKNSWNTDNPYGGYLYVSKPYFLYKTMNILVHKNAIPQDIRQKLGI